MVDDKEKTKEEMEGKKQDVPFWQNLPPIVLIGAAVLLFFAFRSMTLDSESGGSYFFIVIIVIIILFLFGNACGIAKLLS